MDFFISVCIQIGIIAGLGLLLGLLFRGSDGKGFKLGWFLFALFLIFLEDVALSRGFGLLPKLPTPDGLNWNWSGKLQSTLVFLVVASLPFMGWKRVGLTLEWREGAKWAWVAFALGTAAVFAYSLSDGVNGTSSIETIAFQFTMPGIEEELAYRGCILLALNEAFRGRFNGLGTPLSWGALLITIQFGFAHSLFWHDGALGFNYWPFITTSIFGFVFLWLREKSGNLILPIAMHNILNGVMNTL